MWSTRTDVLVNNGVDANAANLSTLPEYLLHNHPLLILDCTQVKMPMNVTHETSILLKI